VKVTGQSAPADPHLGEHGESPLSLQTSPPVQRKRNGNSSGSFGFANQRRERLLLTLLNGF
jgi:hypothetical protein